GALLLTSKLTVQGTLLAGMVRPPKLRLTAPALRLVGIRLPPQVVVTGPPLALILVSISPKAAPVSGVELLLVSVKVTVEVPPLWIVEGLKALLMVGATKFVREKVVISVPE